MQLSAVRGPCSRRHGGKGARTRTHCCRRPQSRRPGRVQQLPPAMIHDCQWQAPGVESFTTGRLQRPVWWWRYRCLTCRADVHLTYGHRRCCILIVGLVTRESAKPPADVSSCCLPTEPPLPQLTGQRRAFALYCTSPRAAPCALVHRTADISGGRFCWWESYPWGSP